MTWFDWACLSVIVLLFVVAIFSNGAPRGTPRIKRATHLHMRASGGRLVECRVTETEEEDLPA
ncbi:hypothetical protein [Sphingomonas aerolata]|uniref:hypothetical protein n=1 Tax=Sphingomonas aerolata TaxID=185951 RepID=UPI00141ADF99|nr:hypothetical protein [Sphingomonas aerolata]NII59804.1 hypothetical protein [Sphingomonas aerolata]